MLGDLASVVDNTMMKPNSNQNSNDKCNEANDHCCNPYSSTCAVGGLCNDCREQMNNYTYIDKLMRTGIGRNTSCEVGDFT